MKRDKITDRPATTTVIIAFIMLAILEDQKTANSKKNSDGSNNAIVFLPNAEQNDTIKYQTDGQTGVQITLNNLSTAEQLMSGFTPQAC